MRGRSLGKPCVCMPRVSFRHTETQRIDSGMTARLVSSNGSRLTRKVVQSAQFSQCTVRSSSLYRAPKRQRLSLLHSASEVGSGDSAEPIIAEVLPESTSLQLAEDLSFHSIHLDGCELLVAATDDGRLDLSSTFVRDYQLDIYSEPERIGKLPETLQRYAEVEWVEEFLGDSLENQEPWQKVQKVYLVQVGQEEPFRLDLEQVFSFQAEDRILRREEVLWLTEERDPQLISLRIRPEGLYIQENSEMMLEQQVSEEHLIREEQARVDELKARNEEGQFANNMPEETSTARDPLDALNDDDREYDETMEDTPEVDQGF